MTATGVEGYAARDSNTEPTLRATSDPSPSMWTYLVIFYDGNKFDAEVIVDVTKEQLTDILAVWEMSSGREINAALQISPDQLDPQYGYEIELTDSTGPVEAGGITTKKICELTRYDVDGEQTNG